MKLTKTSYIIIFCIALFLGVFLRFYQLGNIPNSLDWDEVSWGYNAYSILKTGRDEYGSFMPLSFKAFGDYKQPVYVYLTTVPIQLFGLTPFAVRFTSAFFGSLSIIFVYLFIYELFKKEKYRQEYALTTMFLFAISPWSIQFSRVAFEANVGVFFVLVGVWLFLKGLNEKKSTFLFLSAIPLGISAYTYHSEKIFTPILFVALCLFGYSYFKTRKKVLLLLLIFFFFCNVFWLFDARTTARGRSVTFTSNQTQLLSHPTQEIIYDQSNNDSIGALFHNRRFIYFNQYFENYLAHFDPNFLFISGGYAQHHPFGMGDLYLISLPFILLGLLYLNKRKYWIILLWFFLAPAASALAVDAPNASRSEIFLPTWQIFEAVGLISVCFLWKYKLKSLVIGFILILYMINFGYYIHQYFAHTNSEYGTYWQYGYQQAIESVKNEKTQKIIFSKDFEQPYIFYLFYNKYSPQQYIDDGGSNRMNQKCFNIDNAYFGDCESKLERGDIYVSFKQPPANFQKQKIILDNQGKEVIIISNYL